MKKLITSSLVTITALSGLAGSVGTVGAATNSVTVPSEKTVLKNNEVADKEYGEMPLYGLNLGVWDMVGMRGHHQLLGTNLDSTDSNKPTVNTDSIRIYVKDSVSLDSLHLQWTIQDSLGPGSSSKPISPTYVGESDTPGLKIVEFDTTDYFVPVTNSQREFVSFSYSYEDWTGALQYDLFAYTALTNNNIK